MLHLGALSSKAAGKQKAENVSRIPSPSRPDHLQNGDALAVKSGQKTERDQSIRRLPPSALPQSPTQLQYHHFAEPTSMQSRVAQPSPRANLQPVIPRKPVAAKATKPNHQPISPSLVKPAASRIPAPYQSHEGTRILPPVQGTVRLKPQPKRRSLGAPQAVIARPTLARLQTAPPVILTPAGVYDVNNRWQVDGSHLPRPSRQRACSYSGVATASGYRGSARSHSYASSHTSLPSISETLENGVADDWDKPLAQYNSATRREQSPPVLPRIRALSASVSGIAAPRCSSLSSLSLRRYHSGPANTSVGEAANASSNDDSHAIIPNTNASNSLKTPSRYRRRILSSGLMSKKSSFEVLRSSGSISDSSVIEKYDRSGRRERIDSKQEADALEIAERGKRTSSVGSYENGSFNLRNDISLACLIPETPLRPASSEELNIVSLLAKLYDEAVSGPTVYRIANIVHDDDCMCRPCQVQRLWRRLKACNVPHRSIVLQELYLKIKQWAQPASKTDKMARFYPFLLRLNALEVAVNRLVKDRVSSATEQDNRFRAFMASLSELESTGQRAVETFDLMKKAQRMSIGPVVQPLRLDRTRTL